MINRRQMLITGAKLAVLGSWPNWARGEGRKVGCATFSILGDLASRIGGSDIEFFTLVGPDGDTHEYEPDAADQRRLAGADLVIANGLGFEPWLDRLIEASGFQGRVIIASRRVTPLRKDDGSPDPHAFQDPRNAALYAEEIAAGLTQILPTAATGFAERAAGLKAELEALDRELRAEFSTLTLAKRRLLTSHDAFAYFGRAYGLDFIGIQGLSTADEPSAADLAALARQAKDSQTAAIFLETMSNPVFAEILAKETGLPIGGKLYADSLSPAGGEAADYFAMMRYNARELLDTLRR